MAKKQLPKELFMCWNYDCPDEPFLEHSQDADCLVETGTTITVGVYQLVKKVKLVNRTTIV